MTPKYKCTLEKFSSHKARCTSKLQNNISSVPLFHTSLSSLVLFFVGVRKLRLITCILVYNNNWLGGLREKEYVQAKENK